MRRHCWVFFHRWGPWQPVYMTVPDGGGWRQKLVEGVEHSQCERCGAKRGRTS